MMFDSVTLKPFIHRNDHTNDHNNIIHLPKELLQDHM